MGKSVVGGCWVGRSGDDSLEDVNTWTTSYPCCQPTMDGDQLLELSLKNKKHVHASEWVCLGILVAPNVSYKRRSPQTSSQVCLLVLWYLTPSYRQRDFRREQHHIPNFKRTSSNGGAGCSIYCRVAREQLHLHQHRGRLSPDAAPPLSFSKTKSTNYLRPVQF